MLAKFTAHEAIIMGKAGEEWFTVEEGEEEVSSVLVLVWAQAER